MLDATNYGSLQEAHDSIPETGGQLYIPTSGGPYHERLDISRSHITIESDGATIQQPDNSENYALATSTPDHNADAELVGAHSPGDQAIRVADVSAFSVGDDIYVQEDRIPYGAPPSGGANPPDTTHEYATVANVDAQSRTLALTQPLYLPYPNNNTTEVGVMEWPVTDIRITGLTVRGTANTDSGGNASRPLKIYGAKNAWIDNVTVANAGAFSLGVSGCYQTRFDQITLDGSLRYGMNVFGGSTSTMVTTIEGFDLGRYIVRFGVAGAGLGSVGGHVERIHGHDDNSAASPVANVHFGGFHVRYTGIDAGPDVRTIRFRSHNLTADGFESTQTSGREFEFRQRPHHVLIRDGEILDKQGGPVFAFDLRGASHNERGGDITFEDITIGAYDGRGIADIGFFNDAAEINGLTFRNITYDGQRLTREHVESWRGYSANRITNLVVE